MENTLYYGDNLPMLRKHFADNSVDLIYLDPPFNSQASYNVLFGERSKSDAQIHAFSDTWHWGPVAEMAYSDVMDRGGREADVLQAFRKFLGENDVMAYLTMMTPRLSELRRVLKETGSIFLHCDPTASHYLKIVMDAIFGAKNFRNEIAWCYASGGVSKRYFGKKHDIIFFYSKTDKYKFNTQYRPYSEGTVQRGLTKVKGKYFESGLRKEGAVMNDWWPDITPLLSPTQKERLGYPTQKPLALLERIIKAGSDEGDFILDPFCGCGTAVHASQKLKREWAGIDITHLAIGLIEQRLYDAFEITPKVVGAPEDYEGALDLFKRSPFQFEAWVVSKIGLYPNQHQRGDGGVDGMRHFLVGKDYEGKPKYGKIFASVKGGKNLGVSMIRDFRGAMEREEAALGIFICIGEPTKKMITEAASAGRYKDLGQKDYPKIQIFTLKDLFDGKKPDLPATVREDRRRAELEEYEEQHSLI